MLPKRPITRRELVIDDYHGTKVADPYRWLEDDTSKEVKEWIKEQDDYFNGYINQFGIRKEFEDRLTELWHYARASAPQYVEGLYYTWRNNGLQNQSVLYVSEKLNETGEVFLDPNLLSEDGTVAVMNHKFSPKGNLLAYSLSKSGSDWQTVYVMDVKTKKNLPDVLHHVKFSGFSWLPDESGFFYTRYPEQKVETVLKAEALNSMICLHKVGEPQEKDKLVHNNSAHPEWDHRFFTDHDKKWCFMYISTSTLFKNHLYYKRLDNLDAPWQTIADNFDEGYSVIGTIDDTAFIYTQKNAPFGNIFSVKLTDNGPKEEKIVIPDSGEKLEYYTLVNNHLLCAYIQHAFHKIVIFDPSGKKVRDVKLPAPGSIMGLSCEQDREEFFISFGSYLYPATVLRFDFASEESSVWFSPEINFDFGKYETKQVFYESKDGTKVPMFITCKKDLELNGKNPTLLYGYGGFDIAMTPGFSAANLVWLEKGAVYAVACCRGGSEYGEAWHRAGMLESKQNVFDDFCAAAEFLIKEKYTSSANIGIMGGSNGGLLTGACLTQRPELFGAAIVAVPVLDMLRYHHFTAGRYWTGEYGCADNPEHFPFMYKYSPLHNVRMNTAYPPTLVMTADTDDRVVPGQARKFSATLQAADAGDSPIFVRIEKSAGHGHGKPIKKMIQERADLNTFLWENLK
jgi:prolyl oligopeptidase